MSRVLEQRLTRLIHTDCQGFLKGGRIGLEKETLRVAPDGHIAQTSHPQVLGAPLTHPYITTDYSEALLEFITPPYTDVHEALRFLEDIHRFVYQNNGREMLWATSMPCVVDGENSIPIARYGTSNAGRMKYIYRLGLGHRYGRIMQVIAGVHFNYSLPEDFWTLYRDHEQDHRPLQEFRSVCYLGLIRNLQRFGWLIPYLFGASPAVCKSFMNGKPTPLAEFDDNTYYEPYGTSLRLSDIGYTNSREKKSGLDISYNTLEEYIASLIWATETPCPEYQKIGVVVDGEYRQLNANILQIENEYYSTVRPKQIPAGDEKPVLALKRRGVRYVELRSLDVSAFDPMGMNEPQLRFLEAFLLFCLLHQSPPIAADERREIDANQMAAASRGRDPGLQLQRNGRALALRAWAAEITETMAGICEVLDRGEPERPYTRALALQREAIADPDRTPSARMLAEMRAAGEGFFHFARRISEQHRDYFLRSSLDSVRARFFREQAEQSWQQQQAMEAADTLSFPEYLHRYFAQSDQSAPPLR